MIINWRNVEWGRHVDWWFPLGMAAGPAPPPEVVEFDLEYYRRYLLDVEEIHV